MMKTRSSKGVDYVGCEHCGHPVDGRRLDIRVLAGGLLARILDEQTVCHDGPRAATIDWHEGGEENALGFIERFHPKL